MHQRQYLRWIVLAAMCSLWTCVCKHGAAQTDTSRSERDRYHKVLMKKRKSWPRQMPIGKAWPTDDNPWAPFDLTRMFEESDLIVRARVRGSVHRGLNGKIRYMHLVNTVQKIEAVYKGRVLTDIVEWRTRRQLAIHVIVGTQHTGHWGCADLQFDRPYILFLKRVPRDELVSYGYENEQGVFYKINRIWHGAIVLGSKNVSRCANSQILRNRTPLRHLGLFWSDFAEGVHEMSRDSRTTPSKARLAALAYRAKLYEALAAGAASGKPKQADSALEGVPAEVLDGYEAVSVYRTLAAEKDAEARKKLVARIEFLAILAKDVAKFAAERRAAATKPAGAIVSQKVKAVWKKADVKVAGKSTPIEYRKYEKPVAVEVVPRSEAKRDHPVDAFLSALTCIPAGGSFEEFLEHFADPEKQKRMALKHYSKERFMKTRKAKIAGSEILGQIRYKDYVVVVWRNPVSGQPGKWYYLGTVMSKRDGKYYIDLKAKRENGIFKRLSQDEYSIITGVKE